MIERHTDETGAPGTEDHPGMLELMRLLEQHPDYSQRQLSVAMGVSVGKTHYLLKALVNKGLVKAKNFRGSNNKAGYLYVLTPAGVKRRWHLTREFLSRKEQEYSNLKSQIAALRNEVATAESIGRPQSAASRSRSS